MEKQESDSSTASPSGGTTNEGKYFVPSENVFIDVGGTIFKTNKETLMHSPLFETLMGGWSAESRQGGREDPIFIDRNPTHFSWILDFLRTGSTEGFKKEYLPDLEFFMIDYKERFLSSLYEPYDKVEKDLTTSTISINLELSNDQLLAVKKLHEFTKKKNKNQIFYLEGCAGTGKTTCISYFLNNTVIGGIDGTIVDASPSGGTPFGASNRVDNNNGADKSINSGPYEGSPQEGIRTKTPEEVSGNNLEYSYENVAICAPTHKAVKIIQNLNSCFRCVTLHNILCMIKDIDEYGNVKFVQKKKYKQIFSVLRLVVIDECSMINENIFNIIIKVLNEFPNLKIILIGDPYQLPPINENLSKACQLTPSVKLNNIMRHSGGILDTSLLVRSEIYKRRHKFKESENARFILYEEDWLKSICYCFKNGKNAHVLTWTNSRTNEINKIIRSEIYGEESLKMDYLPNEKCVFNDYLKVDKYVFNTCDIITVRSSYVTTISYSNLNFGISNVFLKVYKLILNDELKITKIHKDSLEDFEKICKKMYAKAKSAKYRTPLGASKNKAWGSVAKKLWNQLYEFKNTYNSPITYNYSTTTHKGQGSTYDIVFVDHNDIFMNKNTYYMNRCLYTAFSRASKMLIVFV